MQSADYILTNAHVLTLDADYRQFRPGAIAIEGNIIVAVGDEQEIAASFQSLETVDCGGKVVMPGLINAHTHAPMTLLRGMADDRRLDVWLLGYMMPVERQFVSPDFCRLGAKLACAEMIMSGITCFADMYYFEDAVAEATAEVGMRGVLSQTVLKFPTPDAQSYEDALALARAYIMRWKGHPLIVPSVAPHAPYTCTLEILEACTQLAVEFDVPLHTHISETLQEVEQWRETYDMPVVPWVKKTGLLAAKVLAAHCVHVDDGEIHTLQRSNVGVAHNPSSNMKLASGFAPVTEMLRAGVNVGIGTDGPASNNDLDMFEEVRLASFIAKGTSGDPTALPARQAITMATRMGAEALHLADLTGSIEPGKRADLIVVDIDTLHSLPHFSLDPDAVYAQLVYATKSSDVQDVMVNGRWLMRQRKLLTINLAPLQAAAAEYAERIDAFMRVRERSVLSKLIAIEGAEQEESYEVQIKVRLKDPQPLIDRLAAGKFEIVRSAHYREYDTYFVFAEPSEGRLRYREDEFIGEQGEVFNVRYRLTLTGPAAEREFPNSVLLSRSRFIAPATHSLRFYREYFSPASETVIHKDRRRWLIRLDGMELFVNIDRIVVPAHDGAYLEIKSRTWSRHDAEDKAAAIAKALEVFGVEAAQPVKLEYPDLVRQSPPPTASA
jgi:5-methylthioadenosine/S-adenosylhomocysteine deaminase